MSADDTLHALHTAAGLVVQRAFGDRRAYDALLATIRSGEVDAELVTESLAALCYAIAHQHAGDHHAAADLVLEVSTRMAAT